MVTELECVIGDLSPENTVNSQAMTSLTVTTPEQVTAIHETPLRLVIKLDDPRGFDPLSWAISLSRCLLENPPAVLALQLPPDRARDQEKILPRLRELLMAMGASSHGYRLITCPTCARCKVDLPALARQVEARLAQLGAPDRVVEVAVMGCEVNGPGEARAADVGAACSGTCGQIFRKGEIVRTVCAEELVEALLDEVDKL